MLTGYELFGGGDVDVLRSALAPQDRKVLHHDISIYHPRFQFHVDLDELSPPESGLDGMESPVEGDEQLRGSDMYPLPPAPQAAPLSRDGGVAAPVLDVSVEGAVGRGRVAGAGPNPDGMESPVEGGEQLRGSDNSLSPAPQAASLSRDGDDAAPMLDVLVPGMVGWDGREADRAAVEALAAERVAVAAAVREGPAAAGSASGGCERGRGRGLARGRVRWRGRVLARERVRGSGRAFARGGGLGGGSGGGCRAAP